MEILNHNVNISDMVTMSSVEHLGVTKLVSSTGNTGTDSGSARSVRMTMVECQNVNNDNCNQNRASNNNNNDTDNCSWKTLSQDPSKMNKLREMVENNSSVTSKCLVESLVQQVNQLTDLEKLLLYLKLPAGRSPDLDPLKQPLNPLGSRSEIQLTITWMKTHLEVDLDVSLPKEEVYNEYMHYCTINSVKALSTADFGKVMKQVFPTVRARRLGHRGASKYCHSGLKKKYVLDIPTLPDLLFNTNSEGSLALAKRNGMKSDYSLDELDKAAGSVIFEWAEKMCNVRLDNYKDLALHLLDKNFVDNRSMAALTLLSLDQRTGSNVKHRETQHQLQKKLQEREQIREQKRKLQEQQPTVNKSNSERQKSRRRSGSIRNVNTESVIGGYPSCKPLGNFIQNSDDVRPNNGVNSRYLVEANNNKLISDPADCKTGQIPSDVFPLTLKREESASNMFNGKSDLVHYNMGCNANELLYPGQKLSRTVSLDSSSSNFSKTPSPKTYFLMSNVSPNNGNNNNNNNANSNMVNKNKYKPIQPKNNCENNNNTLSDIAETDKRGLIGDMIPNQLGEQNAEIHSLQSNFSIKHDEISSKQGVYEPDDLQKLSQLSELRKQLVNYLPPCTNVPLTFPDESSGGDVENDMNVSGIRRKVSFQTSVDELENVNRHNLFGSIVPPSPSMDEKTFSFTPIVNTSCGGISQGPSQASSASASPFVSPRATPLHRSRHNSGQTSSTYVTPRSTPYTPEINVQGMTHSESGSPFMSPAPTPPFPRTRHNSTQNMRTVYPPASRARHSSGAASYRHAPYPEDAGSRRSKCRSRHSSGSIPPSPQSAPHSPLVIENHPLPEPLLLHHHQQQQQPIGNAIQNVLIKHPQQQLPYMSYIDIRRRHVSAGPTVHCQPAAFNYINTSIGTFSHDALCQEVSSVMNSGHPCPNSISTGSSNRPQSVPLPQMLNAVCGSELDTIPKSHPNTPLFNPQQFQFSQDCSLSHPSSYAPTPVPSEFADFGEYSNLEFDPVLGSGNEDSRNTALEAINSSFSNLPSHSDFVSAISESLSTDGRSDESLIVPHFSETAHIQCEEDQSLNVAGLNETSESNKISAPPPAGKLNCLIMKNDQPHSMSLSGNAQITLNALNANPFSAVLGLTSSEDSFASHLEEEEFQHSLVELGNGEFFESII